MERCILYTQVPESGNYTWTVTAVNETGEAASDGMDFSVSIGIYAPAAYRPNTTLSNQRAITFEWEDVGYAPNASRIQVEDNGTNQICLDQTFSKNDM